MTNTLAIILAALIAAAIAADLLLGLGASLFLARRFADLVEWMSFWR